MPRQANMPATGGEYSTRELVVWAAGQLRACEGANSQMDARILMEWVTGAESWWQVPTMIGAHAAERFRSAVARRRYHEPLQHIVGAMWFRSLKLDAAPGVFIVRPETEMLAQVAIDRAADIASSGQVPVVVDLCTGSGAIALSIATEVPSSRVWAVELMDRAYEVANQNIGRISPLNVRLVHGNALTALPELDGQIDVVVSNPPYVPAADVTQAEAFHDPAEALYGGGEDGMIIPRGIIHRANRLLKPGGLLVMEHAEVQSQQLREEALGAGMINVRTGQDLTGRDRMLIAEREGTP